MRLSSHIKPENCSSIDELNDAIYAVNMAMAHRQKYGFNIPVYFIKYLAQLEQKKTNLQQIKTPTTL